MKIILNGKRVDKPVKTAFELKGSNDVVILNGYQLSEDADLKDGDTLCVIKKGVMPKKNELESMMSARHTPGVYKRLKAGRVAIAGLGGLGSNIAISLARIGVGKLLLVDYDVVEPSNLNRQNYDLTHLGMLKTQAMKSQIEKINPFIEVEICTAKVTEENVLSIFKDYPIVCEAFDNPEFKAMLTSILLEEGDKKIVAASGMAGFDSANNIKTKQKFKNLYVCGDFETEAKEGIGLMAPRVQVCAAHQSNMVLRLLLNIEKV